MEKYALTDARKRLIQTEALRACGIRPKDRILVAFSGGADSTALLLSLEELLREGAFSALYAAHLDHGIRGETAEADRLWCESFCRLRGIPFQSERADAPRLAKDAGMTLEEAARALRYDFLERARQRFAADYVAVAHQRDDQAETVLLHLLRGCGTAGLGGMKRRAGTIVRPLLDVSRAEVEAYLASRGAAYRVDETNARDFALRNRLRNELLPAMRAYQPRVSEALCRTAALCAEDEDYLSALADEAGRRLRDGDGFARRALAALPKPLSSRIVRAALLALSGDVTEADVRRVLALSIARTGTCIELAGGFSAWVDAGTLHIGYYPAALSFEVPFCRFGETRTPAGTLVSERVAQYRTPQDGQEAFLALEALPEGLVVRTRRAGDRFFPLGAPGERKLSDVLTDRKIPREHRDLPLLCAGSEVYWAVGLTVSERARVTGQTREILHITMKGVEA